MDIGAAIGIAAGALAIAGVFLKLGAVWGEKNAPEAAMAVRLDKLERALEVAITRFDGATQRLERLIREHGRDLDGQDVQHRERWHEHDRTIQALHTRVALLEHEAGVPVQVAQDRTPVQSVGARPRVHEDSG